MHHICNFARLCFNNNKNTTLKKHKKKQKKHKKRFLNFYKNIKNVFYIYGFQGLVFFYTSCNTVVHRLK